jgi:peptide deformylase
VRRNALHPVEIRCAAYSLRFMPDAWIRQWGDAALREVAAPVADIDDLLRRRVRRMADRLLEADGAGLAATQVGFLRRLFVYRESRESPVDVLINPRVVASASEDAVFEEGCLSFMAVTVAVRRPVAVRVEAVDLEGRPVTIDGEGPLASLMQHEIDHLDGILTLDRAEPAERRRALAILLGRAVASAA